MIKHFILNSKQQTAVLFLFGSEQIFPSHAEFRSDNWFAVLRCRYRSGESVRLQRVLGGHQRPVRTVRLHCHNEIGQLWRLWEWDTRWTVHQPALPGTRNSFPFIVFHQLETDWVVFFIKKQIGFYFMKPFLYFCWEQRYAFGSIYFICTIHNVGTFLCLLHSKYDFCI